MDDETTMLIAANFHPLRPLTEKEVARLRAGAGAGFVGADKFLPPTNEPGGAWRPKASQENDFFFDRESQRTKLFSGIPEFWAQDAGVQEGMGAIYDRAQEHLGSSDTAIIRARQRLMDEARTFKESAASPPGALNPAVYRARAAAAVLPKDADWIEATKELRKAIPGVNPSAPSR
jgi:phthalate 4,5-dioxygenase oxygenase subunit